MFYRRAWVGDKPRVPDPFDKRPPYQPRYVIEVKMQTRNGLAIRNDARDARGEVAAFVIDNDLTSIDGLEEMQHSQGFAFVGKSSIVKDTYSTRFPKTDLICGLDTCQ